MIQFRGERAYGAASPTAVLNDERTWHKIRRVTESLYHDDAAADDGTVAVKEFDTGVNRFRACAIPLNGGGYPGVTVLVAVQPEGARFPSVGELRRRYQLTEREAEVALLLARRRTNREIAEALCVTDYTARRHTERVLQKLGVKRRTEVESVLLGTGQDRAG